MDAPSLTFRNQILGGLDCAEQDRLVPHLRPVTFDAEDVILSAGSIRYCHFIEAGIVSLTFRPDRASSVEVGIVSSNGMLGLTAVLASGEMVNTAVAVTRCHTLAIDAAVLGSLVQASDALRRALLRYTEIRLAHTMRVSACHLSHHLEQRLASWILAATGLTASAEVAVTHRQLAQLLGTTRPTMTLATQVLEGHQAIRAKRGLIVVRDRNRLAALSCSCYQPQQHPPPARHAMKRHQPARMTVPSDP
jgi:CRP-like cAMP-binding protein